MSLDGLQLGRYRLQNLLGRGGMGEVYLAEDTHISRQVAIKVIRSGGMPFPGGMTAEDANRLFLREARAIATLQHPYILPLFDYGDAVQGGSRLHYMVMPYCQEGSLDTWLSRKGDFHLLHLHQIAHILEQAADALQYAHDKQIIHQDVKLSNFLIHRWRTPDLPDLLLADFGIAKLLTANSSSSQSLRGTPTSMAPEQWEGHPVFATDQYALAVMIYQLLSGHLPFQGGPGQIMYQHLTVQPQPPGTWQQGISPAVDAVILKALSKKPQERFENVLTFAQAFQQALPIGSVSEDKDKGRDIRGDALNVTLALSPEEALSGARRTLTLSGGKSIQITVPPGVKTGQTIRLGTLNDPSNKDLSVQALVVTIVVLRSEQESSTHLLADEKTLLRSSTPPPTDIPLDRTPPTLLSASSSLEEVRPNRNKEMGNQHRDLTRNKSLLSALLILILIAGSGWLTLYLTRSSSPSNPTRSVSSTTKAATRQALPRNPYPPYQGTLSLNDPLSDNTRGYSWEEGTRDQGTCTFTGGMYHSNISLAGYFHSCLALSSSYSNFAFEVQINFISSSAGGIVFRADRATTHFYYFALDRQGGYLLKAYYDKKGDATVIASGSGLPFNATELLGVVAQGSTISLYVNHQLIQQVQNGLFIHGQAGVVAYEGEAAFSNAKVWVL